MDLLVDDTRYGLIESSWFAHGPDCGLDNCDAMGIFIGERALHWRKFFEGLAHWTAVAEGRPSGQLPTDKQLSLLFQAIGLPESLLTAMREDRTLMDKEVVAYLANFSRRLDLEPSATPQAPTVLLLGASGAGKSTVIGHLLNTLDYEFPAVTPGRTTTSVTSVRSEPLDDLWSANIKFYSRGTIRNWVQDNVREASKAARSRAGDREIRSRLLTHPSLNLRLTYVVEEQECMQWIELIKKDVHSREIVNVILAHLLDRINKLAAGRLTRDRSGWPRTWVYKEANREEFFSNLVILAGVNRRRFGALLSPLVRRTQVRGAFAPSWGGTAYRLRLVDLEGLGQNAATGGADSFTRQHVVWLRSADAVIVVDDSKAPQGRETREALEAMVRAEQVHKLVLLQTRMDLAIDYQVTHDIYDVRERLPSAVANTVRALYESGVPSGEVDKLRRRLAAHTYYSGYLPALSREESSMVDSRLGEGELTFVLDEMKRLLEYLTDSSRGSRSRGLQLARQLYEPLLADQGIQGEF